MTNRPIESLENRQLMAVYVAAEYFPLPTGQTWTYQSTVESKSTTVKRTTAAATIGSTAVVRQREQATSSGVSVLIDRFFRHDGSGGLRLYQMAMDASGYLTGSIQFNPAFRVMPKTFDVGSLGSWKNQSVSATIKIASLDNVSHSVTGTDSGSASIITAPDESRAGYTFYHVLKFQSQHTHSYTASVNGASYKVTIAITENSNLARGVGLISGSSTLSIKVTGPGVNYSKSLSESDVLTSSSLLGGFTRFVGSTLRVGGTTGNDVITAGLDNGNILVVRNDIGIKPASADDITRIVIDTGDGNDLIGTLNLGRMRSTLIGGKGNDNLNGGAGRDLIYGGDGNDTIIGNTGIDTIYGDAGNDMINGNGGADYIDGGIGADTARRDTLDTRIAIEVLVG